MDSFVEVPGFTFQKVNVQMTESLNGRTTMLIDRGTFKVVASSAEPQPGAYNPFAFIVEGSNNGRVVLLSENMTAIHGIKVFSRSGLRKGKTTIELSNGLHYQDNTRETPVAASKVILKMSEEDHDKLHSRIISHS